MSFMDDYQKTYELYDDWNEEKKYTQFSRESSQNFRAGEIWWVKVGINLGDEIDGKHENFERPVLILKKYHSKLFLALPLTSRNKVGSFFKEISYNGKVGNVIFAQAKTMSSSRLLRRLHHISDNKLAEVVESYRQFLS
jgi:mRNA interferase MazF